MRLGFRKVDDNLIRRSFFMGNLIDRGLGKVENNSDGIGVELGKTYPYERRIFHGKGFLRA